MSWDHASELKERIVRFDEMIVRLKTARDEVIARRRGAADHVMVELDERLAASTRTLEALERSRALSHEDLQREESRQAGNIRGRIVVVDDTTEGRFILSKLVLSRMPGAEIVECESSDAALAELRTSNPAVFLIHRANDVDGLPLIELLRAASPVIPILYVSGIDRTDAALAAGATTFLQYDQPQSIGRVILDILRPPGTPRGA